jgi:hypothetical protein
MHTKAFLRPGGNKSRRQGTPRVCSSLGQLGLWHPFAIDADCVALLQLRIKQVARVAKPLASALGRFDIYT